MSAFASLRLSTCGRADVSASVPLGVRGSVQEATTMSICVTICVCVSMCLAGECTFVYTSLWVYTSLSVDSSVSMQAYPCLPFSVCDCVYSRVCMFFLSLC